jgi:hypothetical protein
MEHLVDTLWNALLRLLEHVSWTVVVLITVWLLRKQLAELIVSIAHKVGKLAGFGSNQFSASFWPEQGPAGPPPGGEAVPRRPRRPSPKAPAQIAFPAEVQAAMDAEVAQLGIAPTALGTEAVELLSTLLIHEEEHGLGWPGTWGMNITGPSEVRERFDRGVRETLQRDLVVRFHDDAGRPMIGLSFTGRAFCRHFRAALSGDLWEEARQAQMQQ